MPLEQSPPACGSWGGEWSALAVSPNFQEVYPQPAGTRTDLVTPMVTQEQVAAEIIRLSPKLRTVFVLAYVLGRSRQEIAVALGISERRVDLRLTRALGTCRARLVSRGFDGTLAH